MQRAEVKQVLAGAPRAGFLLPALFSAMTLMAPFVASNAGLALEDAYRLLLYVYMASFPVVVVGVYNAYRLAGMLERCGGHADAVYFLAALVPGLYVSALSAVAGQLAQCLGRQRQAPPILDVVLAAATMGLHTAFYGLSFERLLSAIYVESLEE